MDYTIENGVFYKVLDSETGELITFGKIESGNVLSTIHPVEWITENEYLTLEENNN